MRWVVLIIFACAQSPGLRAWAEEATAPAPSAPKLAPDAKSLKVPPGSEDEFSSSEESSEGDAAPIVKSSKAKESKGKRYREKEAEGTEAPDRFEADTIIKSRYRHNGEQLEVDPD